MSALLIRILTCDGTTNGDVCDAEWGGDPDFGGSVALMREMAAAAGWRSNDLGRDLCPACAKDIQ